MNTITKQFLKKTRACVEGAHYAIHNLLDKPYDEAIKHLIKDEKLQWANWLIVRVLDKQNKVRYAVYAAKQVLKTFENKYPDDKRPREAIKAAERWVKNPNEENRTNADDAAYAADTAANTANTAAYAAYAAANAADTAANAAADAAYAAADAAANAAANAAEAAANAADAAANADTADAMRIKIVRYGVGLLRKQGKEEAQ